MAKRITIMLDDDLDRKVRIKQAELIKKTQKSVSFSSVINDVLRGKVRL
jgi:hypothetical protein